MGAPLPAIAYAKNAAHERFVQAFQGQLKGRYLLTYLVGIEVLGAVHSGSRSRASSASRSTVPTSGTRSGMRW